MTAKRSSAIDAASGTAEKIAYIVLTGITIKSNIFYIFPTLQAKITPSIGYMVFATNTPLMDFASPPPLLKNYAE